jgi:hypothetical protein
MAQDDLIKMFEPGEWCLLRSGTNLSIKANKADVGPYKVDGQAYKTWLPSSTPLACVKTSTVNL